MSSRSGWVDEHSPSALVAPMPATGPDGGRASHRQPGRRWRHVGLRLLVARVSGQGLEFAAFAVLAHRLGAGDFGRLSLAFLTCRYAGLVADWGASIRGVRDTAVSQQSSVYGLLRRRNRVTAVLTPTYMVVVALLGRPELAVLGVALAGRGLNRDWLSLGRQQATRAGLPALVQGAVMLSAAVAVRSLGWAAFAVALGYGAALALSLALNRLPSKRDASPASVDGWLLAAGMADQVTASSDIVMLAVFRSAGEAGIYAAVYRIPNAWVTLIGLTVLGLIPTTARVLACDRARLQELRQRALRLGLLAGGAVLATIPLSYVLAPALFGREFAAGQGPLVVLLLATAVMAVAAPLHPIFIALGRDRAVCTIAVSAAALNVASNLVVIPSFGMTGAATTTLVAQLVLLVAVWRGTAPGPVRKARA